MMNIEDVLSEVRRRKNEGDMFMSDVESWLLRLPFHKKTVSITEREAICSKCKNVSRSKLWCCVNKKKPQMLKDMNHPPSDCPFSVEFVVSEK
jgi:hypothetical protein